MTQGIRIDENWSILRWLFLIGLLLLAQIVLLKIFSSPPPDSKTESSLPCSFGLLILPPAPTESERIHLESLEDPTLFALANPRGYSGQSWLFQPVLSNHYTRWKPPDEWLSPGDVRVGVDLSGVTEENFDQLLSLAKELPPPEAEVPEAEVPQKTWVTFEGELADRGVAEMPDAPSWPIEGVLKPTVVRLIVNEKGFPLNAALVQTNGLVEADQKALDLCYRIRFAPMEEDVEGRRKTGIQWGRAVFHWHTVLPPQAETNLIQP